MSEGRSVLIAAHTNIAVDNAIMRLVKSCDEKKLNLKEGQAVRFGVTKALDEPPYNKAYIPAIIERRTNTLSARKEKIVARLEQIRVEKLAWQQEKQQGLPTWETQRLQLITQCDICKNALIPLLNREKQRIAVIDAQIRQAEERLRNTQREIENVKQTLAQTVNQQVQLKLVRARHVSTANEFETSLAEAQQMNAIKRLFKGISIEKLSHQVAQEKQNIWQDEQNLTNLQGKINALHSEQNRIERFINQQYQEYNTSKYQKNLSSSAAQQIAQLQTEQTQLEVQITQGDTIHAQQKKQRKVQELLYKNEVEKLEEEQSEIDKQLQDIERKIVAEAQVVATTLSKVYMNPTLSERKFGVVIMDEVSMAPLPATYVVACHAKHSVIALGDPQQLAPIVNAKTKVAEKWLGESLFDRNKITLENAAHNGYGNSSVLKYQSRMHPDIATIANRYIYNEKLYNSSRVMKEQETYSSIAPLPEKHLLLCDTSDASPIATKPEEGSRINIYHALCIIAIAQQVLSTLPSLKDSQSDTIRIGIVTPYKKQAELLQHLVTDANLDKYINTGTVHRFQGLEYDVIIFDTVESRFLKPNFTKGEHDSNAMRLVNVAVTRARHKLIIVANAAYIHAKFAASDTLRLAVEEAQRNTINSNDVLKVSFSKISDALKKIQENKDKSTLMHHVETEIKKNPSQLDAEAFFKEFRWLDEQTFFEEFIKDIQASEKEIVIISPFLAKHRTRSLLSLLQEKRTNGVKVLVITKPLDEYSIEGRAEAEQMLKSVDIDVQYRKSMHEKIAIIDDKLVYSGSLNILSHSNTSECMIRLISEGFAREIESLIGLRNSSKSYKNKEKDVERRSDDIVVYLREFPKLKGACGHEITARTGTNGSFYGCVNWRTCTHKEKNKDITEEHLTSISRLTTISCTECSSKTPMTLKVNRKDIWLECSNATSCDHKRNIIITKD